MELLTKKKTYNNDLKKIFNLMTIDGTAYTVIGSNALDSIKYGSDYDLSDNLVSEKQMLDKLYQSFLQKFKICHESHDKWITDFKCGLDTDEEPLRWSYEDMIKNKKVLKDGRVVKFQDVIFNKATMKLDVIALVDSPKGVYAPKGGYKVFTEFSENYYIQMGLDKDMKTRNFFDFETERETALNSIAKEFDYLLFVKRYYLKALKRSMSYKMLESKSLNKKELISIIHFLNGPVGVINKIKGTLENILMIVANKFKTCPDDIILYNINLCLFSLKAYMPLRGYNLSKADLIKNLEIQKINKVDKKSIKYIEDLIDKIYDLCNKETLMFIQNNKKVLIY
jgi:hypothetical protein